MVCVRAHECVCEREREKVREESEENGHGAPVIILSSEIRQVWKIVSMTFSNLEPVGVSCDSFKALVTEYGNEILASIGPKPKINLQKKFSLKISASA